jgi:hypothetical protein
MRHLILYVNKNTSAEFEREAAAYAKHHNALGHEVLMVPVPCQLPALRRSAAVENTVTQVFQQHNKAPFNVFAYFGHGTEQWIQTGHLLTRIGGLVGLLEGIMAPKATLWFASGRTAAHNPRERGSENRGLLEEIVRLCDACELTAWGHTTAGHNTAGHNTKNPNLACITAHNYSLASPEQIKTLYKHLHLLDSTLRFQIPLCSSIDDLLERIAL